MAQFRKTGLVAESAASKMLYDLFPILIKSDRCFDKKYCFSALWQISHNNFADFDINPITQFSPHKYFRNATAQKNSSKFHFQDVIEIEIRTKYQT